MSHKVYILIAISLCFSASSFVKAQDITNIHVRVNNANDYEAVRKVVRQEIQGWFNNDPEQIYSVFDAENFVGIAARGSNDPKEWTVFGSGRADVRAYADGAKGQYDSVPEGYQHKAEVQHVHIKGNHALAVARQWLHVPDEEKNITTDGQFQAVWILKKSGGQWKVISVIGQVTSERKVTEN